MARPFFVVNSENNLMQLSAEDHDSLVAFFH